MNKKIVAANWKMNKTVAESVDFTKSLAKNLLNLKETGIILCPPFTSLFKIGEILKETSIAIGGQNMHFEESGAFTGEISADMLNSANCEYVILGHSERRHVFNESNQFIKKKIDVALEKGLQPIICVGEKLEEREAGKTLDVVTEQYESALDGLSSSEVKKCLIAYEPVWAIGTGLTATPKQASEAHGVIRDLLTKQFDIETAEEITILYGGSVKPNNASSLIAAKDIDGFLVGGASLKVDSFLELSLIVENYLTKQG